MKVSFKLNKALTKIGEIVCIVGNQENLGSWNPASSKHMETNELIQPAWISSDQLVVNSIFEASNVEYKYVICSMDLKKMTWESGDNRKLDLSAFY
jgi:hypothetical protein